MRYATFLSALLHVGVLAAGLIAWPFVKPELEIYKPVVPIELLSEAEIADQLTVPADQKSEDVADEPKMLSGNVEQTTLPDPLPPPPDPEPEPEPEEPEPEPEEVEPEPEPEKDEPKEQPKPQKEPEKIDDLSFLEEALVDLEDEEKKAPAEVLDAEGLSDQESVGLGDRLTAAEEDKIRAAMLRCYDQPTGVPNAEELVVRVRFQLDRDGELRDTPRVLNARQIALSSNSWWRATEDRAVRAVIDCAPYDYLPQDRYHQWETVILNFSPLGVM